jgi:hypothetical protein
MTPSKHHQIGGPEIVESVGLVILIDMIYKYFGSGMHVPVTLTALAVFTTGLFLLLWPMSLKSRL